MCITKESKLKKRKLASKITNEIIRVTERKLQLTTKENSSLLELQTIEIYQNYIDKLEDILQTVYLYHFTKTELHFKEVVNYEI